MSNMKYVFPVIGIAFAVILAIAYMWVFGVAIFSTSTAETRGQTEIREDTVADGDYRIQAYESFYEMCGNIQGIEGRIEALEEEYDSADPQRQAQIETTLTALRGQREESIAEYNAEARKEATAAQFKASDLPPVLDSEEETTCTVEN